jgi:hypothetical protein
MTRDVQFLRTVSVVLGGRNEHVREIADMSSIFFVSESGESPAETIAI